MMEIKPEDLENLDDLDAWFSKPKISRPSHCPQCGYEQVKRIVYGLPSEDDPTPAEERDYVLGGCIFDLDSPSWYCGSCGHRWG